MTVRLAAFVLLWTVTLRAAEIKGTVANVAGGEPLGRVQVSVLEAGRNAVTATNGTFAIQNLPPGSYTLRINAVGYRLSTFSFSLSGAEDVKEFSLTLIPDNFRHTETVQVKGDIFQQEDSPAISQSNLTSSEIREASTVFADDPFRAVQALPGVSAPGNNEFYAQFSVMGAPFQNVSIYLDDVLATPFHSIPDISNGASLSLLTSETVEEMKLMPVAYPVKFADGIGAALDIRTREGSRSVPLFRASAGIAESDILGEGEVGSAKRGSWIASARKSYIGYLIRNRESDVQDVSFYDADLKFTYDLTPKHSVSFHSLGGQTSTRLNSSNSNPDAFATGTSAFTLARVGWRWSATPHISLDSHAAYLSEPHDAHNSFGQLLDSYADGEWHPGNLGVEEQRFARRWRDPAEVARQWLFRFFQRNRSAVFLFSRRHRSEGQRLFAASLYGHEEPLAPHGRRALGQPAKDWRPPFLGTNLSSGPCPRRNGIAIRGGSIRSVSGFSASGSAIVRGIRQSA
jgi:hypothetical protein